MKQVKEFLRTFIMTVIILFILSGFISPEIASFADRPSPNRVDSVGLKMLPLGTQEDFNRQTM